MIKEKCSTLLNVYQTRPFSPKAEFLNFRQVDMRLKPKTYKKKKQIKYVVMKIITQECRKSVRQVIRKV